MYAPSICKTYQAVFLTDHWHAFLHSRSTTMDKSAYDGCERCLQNQLDGQTQSYIICCEFGCVINYVVRLFRYVVMYFGFMYVVNFR